MGYRANCLELRDKKRPLQEWSYNSLSQEYNQWLYVYIKCISMRLADFFVTMCFQGPFNPPIPLLFISKLFAHIMWCFGQEYTALVCIKWTMADASESHLLYHYVKAAESSPLSEMSR